MKKLILIGLMVGLCFANNAGIRVGNTGGTVQSGYEFFVMEVKGQTIPSTSATTFYLDNIAGYASIDFYGMVVSAGSAVTTINAQPVYSNGVNLGAAQIITSGTDLTDIRSPWYKITIPRYPAANRKVSFNILIAD